jgi:hypothetical protein
MNRSSLKVSLMLNSSPFSIKIGNPAFSTTEASSVKSASKSCRYAVLSCLYPKV